MVRLNKRLTKQQEFDTLKKFDYSSQQHIDCIRFSKATGDKHRAMLLRLCNEAMENGHRFLTEARLSSTSDFDKLVADFVDLYDGDVVEIVDTESDKSIERKKQIYERYGLGFVRVNA